MQIIYYTKIAGLNSNCWKMHTVFADSITKSIMHEWPEISVL